MIDFIRKVFTREEPNGLPEGKVDMTAALSAKVIRADGTVEDCGVVSRRVVTTEFVDLLVEMLRNAPSSNFTDFKYHVSGVNTAAENAADTQATFASPDGDPLDSGTQVTGSGDNVYRSVATINYTGAKAVTEHGLVNNSTLASSTLLDRSVFSEINVGNGDSIEFTYDLTCNSGG